jgi:hypothetical protein
LSNLVKQPPARTLSLKLNPRPVRLAYVVRDRADLLDAIRLLSHVWGGKSDALLPQPTNDDERRQLREALVEFDPDCILVAPEEVGEELASVFAPLPCIKRRLRPQELAEFLSGLNPILVGSGSMSEPYSIFHEEYPSGLPASRIVVIDHEPPFDFLTRVIWGDPQASVGIWLRNTFAAKLLRAPRTIRELVRTSLVRNERVTPIDITSTIAYPDLSYRGLEGLIDPLRGALTRNEHSIFLFLDDGETLSAACAYWNARAAASSNKLLLSLSEFREALDESLRDIASTRRVDNWIVVAESDDTLANDLLNAIRGSLQAQGLGGEVAVISGGFKYSIAPFRMVSGGSTSMTLSVGSEEDVRFVPPRPKHSQDGSVFGFDAEVIRPGGDKLSLPVTIESALLLSNSADRLRRFDSNEAGMGALWLSGRMRVRPRRDGIASVTSPEEESVWYLPSPDRVVQRALLSRGITLSANRHTRYAIGVSNRLGGLDAALAFSRSGGFRLLKPLMGERATQSGLRNQQFQQLLQTEEGLSQDAAAKVLSEHLPRLLATGLIRRGFALTCRNCDLTGWYGVKELREFVECAGCGESFQLTGPRLAFSYVINELARRMTAEGGLAVLSTAAALDAMGAQNIQLGGDLTLAAGTQPFAEIDILSATRDAFVIAECKDRRDLTRRAALEEVAESLSKAIALAPTVGAHIVVLGIVTRTSDDELLRLVSEAAERAAQSGVAVHLILNGQLFASGTQPAIEPGRVALRNLLVQPENEGGLRLFGDLPKSFGGGRIASVVSEEVINAWEFGALDNPEFGRGSS